MTTLLKPILVREELLKRNIHFFSPHLFTQIFQVPSYTSKYFLEKQVKEGMFLRLKKGLYTLKTDLPSEEEIANALYQPSYISFAYALAYYNVLVDMPYQITCATTKSTRLFTFSRYTISYHKIKIKAYTGYSLVTKNNYSFLIAEPEKALVDYLYINYCAQKKDYVHLTLSLINEHRLILKSLNKSKVIVYSRLFQHRKLTNLINKIYDRN